MNPAQKKGPMPLGGGAGLSENDSKNCETHYTAIADRLALLREIQALAGGAR